eukprot:5787552-Amphidinium_carterae.1
MQSRANYNKPKTCPADHNQSCKRFENYLDSKISALSIQNPFGCDLSHLKCAVEGQKNEMVKLWKKTIITSYFGACNASACAGDKLQVVFTSKPPLEVV